MCLGRDGKEGPHQPLIEEPEFTMAISNLTTPLGKEAVLNCVVDHLGRYKVRNLLVIHLLFKIFLKFYK